jgi:hypothetical protein
MALTAGIGLDKVQGDLRQEVAEVQGCPLEGGEPSSWEPQFQVVIATQSVFTPNTVWVGVWRESLAGHVRFFLLQAWAYGPGSPCPVIWAWSPGPAYTLQLTQDTPAGSGLMRCSTRDPSWLGRLNPSLFLFPFLQIRTHSIFFLTHSCLFLSSEPSGLSP